MSLPPCSQQKEAELVTPDSSHLQTFGGLLVESCHQPENFLDGDRAGSLLRLFLGHLIDSCELLLRIKRGAHAERSYAFQGAWRWGGLTYAVTQLVLA